MVAMASRPMVSWCYHHTAIPRNLQHAMRFFTAALTFFCPRQLTKDLSKASGISSNSCASQSKGFKVRRLRRVIHTTRLPQRPTLPARAARKKKTNYFIGVVPRSWTCQTARSGEGGVVVCIIPLPVRAKEIVKRRHHWQAQRQQPK